MKKDLSKETYLRVTAGEKADRLAGRYRREWLLPGAQLVAWVGQEQARLAQVRLHVRVLANANTQHI